MSYATKTQARAEAQNIIPTPYEMATEEEKENFEETTV